MNDTFIGRACGRMLSFFEKPFTKRTLNVLCALWLLFLIVPMLGMCFHAHPVYDDFPHIIDASRAWAETGSLGKTLAAAWQRMVNMYNTWQGTFGAMFNSAFQPMVFSPSLFWITPCLTIVCLFLTALYMIRAAGRLLGMEASRVLWLYTLFMTLLIQYLPGVREVIYWQSGIPYTISFIALFLMTGLMTGAPAGRHTWLRCILIALCGITLGGCPYPAALSGTVGLMLTALACLKKNAKLRAASLTALLSTLAALAVVIAAPGNGVRQSAVGAVMNPVKAVVQSLAECAEFTAHHTGPETLAFVFLAAVILAPALKRCSFTFRLPLLVTFLSFGVLAASYVPPVYATGVEGARIDRIQAALYMLWCFLLLLNVLWWTGWLLARRCRMPETVSRGAVLLAALCMVWGMFGYGVMATPAVCCTKSLLNGSAAAYSSAMRARADAMAAAQDAESLRACITFVDGPSVLPLDKLPGQLSTTLPETMQSYYRLYIPEEK